MREEAADFLVLRGPGIEQAGLDQHVARRRAAGIGDTTRRSRWSLCRPRRRSARARIRCRATAEAVSRRSRRLRRRRRPARHRNALLRLRCRRRLRRRRRGSRARGRIGRRRALPPEIEAGTSSDREQREQPRQDSAALGRECRRPGRRNQGRRQEHRPGVAVGASDSASAGGERNGRPNDPPESARWTAERRRGSASVSRLRRVELARRRGVAGRAARLGAGAGAARPAAFRRGRVTVPLRLKFSSSRGPIASVAGVLVVGAGGVLRDRRRGTSASALPLPRCQSASLPSFHPAHCRVSRAAS